MDGSSETLGMNTGSGELPVLRKVGTIDSPLGKKRLSFRVGGCLVVVGHETHKPPKKMIVSITKKMSLLGTKKRKNVFPTLNAIFGGRTGKLAVC